MQGVQPSDDLPLEVEHFLRKGRLDAVGQIHRQDSPVVVPRTGMAFSRAHPVHHFLVVGGIRRVEGDGGDPVEGGARRDGDR